MRLLLTTLDLALQCGPWFKLGYILHIVTATYLNLQPSVSLKLGQHLFEKITAPTCPGCVPCMLLVICGVGTQIEAFFEELLASFISWV